jgi:hypothetical protein
LTKGGARDEKLLRQELEVLDDIYQRLQRSPAAQYLIIRQKKARINGNRFWYASILFALNEKERAKDVLRDMAKNASQFDLQTAEPGHVNIYKVFNQPYEIILKNDGDVETRDTGVLNQYYNPAQLALAACATLDESGSDAIQKFTDQIGRATLSDYYVVAASAENASQIDSFGEAVRKAIDRTDASWVPKREDFLRRVSSQEVAGFSEIIKRGAEKCGIEAATRDQIFAPFAFKPRTEHYQGIAKYPNQLIVGGRLNANQAKTVADFLDEMISEKENTPLQDLQAKMNTEKPFFVRMQVDK